MPNNFKKSNSFSGGRGGRTEGGSRGRDFNKPSFGGGFNRGGAGGNRPVEMHQTTCADCQKMCEVPFRPNGKKPVYCKDCFGKNGGQSPENTRNYPQREVKADTQDLAKQFEIMNSKLDKLISIAIALIPEVKPPVEKIVKKVAPKKK